MQLFRLREQSLYKYILIEGNCRRFHGCKDTQRPGRGRVFRGPDVAHFSVNARDIGGGGFDDIDFGEETLDDLPRRSIKGKSNIPTILC